MFRNKENMLAAVRSIQKPVVNTGLRAFSVPAYNPDLKSQATKPKVRKGGERLSE